MIVSKEGCLLRSKSCHLDVDFERKRKRITTEESKLSRELSCKIRKTTNELTVEPKNQSPNPIKKAWTIETRHVEAHKKNRNREMKNDRKNRIKSICSSKFSNLTCIPKQHAKRNTMYIFVISMLCIMFSFPIILLPMHDQTKSPEYWWETIYTSHLSYTLSLVLTVVQECNIIFSSVFKISIVACFRTYLLVAIIGIMLYMTASLIWTPYFNYKPPIPFIGVMGYIIYISIQI